jgi:hypothetical protein
LEQPTIFYAVALTLAFLNAGSGLNARLAWLYVALRIVHSLVQALMKKVMIRVCALRGCFGRFAGYGDPCRVHCIFDVGLRPPSVDHA